MMGKSNDDVSSPFGITFEIQMEEWGEGSELNMFQWPTPEKWVNDSK